MLYFIYGPDDYLLRQHVQTAVEKFRLQYPHADVFRLDAAESQATSKIADIIRSNSLFEPSRIIIIKNFASAGVEDWKIALKQAENDDKTAVMAYWTTGDKNSATKNKVFLSYAEKAGNVINVPLLAGQRLNDWIRQEFKRRNCSIDANAAHILADRAGAQAWILAQEIEKLSNHAQRGQITASDVQSLVPERLELSIFDFVDALGARNRPMALALLYQHLSSGADPYYMFSMIVYQFRNLLIVRDLTDRSLSPSQMAKKSGLHPFVVRKTMAQASRYTQNELKKIYSLLAELDTDFKNGTADITERLYAIALQSSY